MNNNDNKALEENFNVFVPTKCNIGTKYFHLIKGRKSI